MKERREKRFLNKKNEKEHKKYFEKYFACPQCGKAICSEKRSYFVCPKCGRALCEENELQDFSDNYCGNCGEEISSAREKALLTK